MGSVLAVQIRMRLSGPLPAGRAAPGGGTVVKWRLMVSREPCTDVQ